MNKKLIIFGLFAIVLAIAGFIIAETSDLEIELNNLVSDLEGNNYGWLVDYNVDYPSVEVYEENFSLKIADFGIIDENKKYQIYLDGSSGAGLGNKTQNIFDLKILGGSVVFDYIVDPIILGNANSLNTNTTYENNFTHLNVSNSSIVAYYPFDDNVSATIAYDYTENHNDGTPTGGAVFNSLGVYGGAYTFDGGSDYINFSDNSFFELQNYTISLWVKRAAISTTQSVIGLQRQIISGSQPVGVLIRFDASNHIEFYNVINNIHEGITTTATYTSTTNYMHIVAIKNGTTVNLYVDNVNVASGTLSDALVDYVTSSSKRTFIGADWSGATSLPVWFYSGNIDEVMIWNTALNSTEVLAIYNNQTARFHGTGEMNYTGVNFAGNNTINITLAGCQQNVGTSLRAKVNNGAYVNFSSGCTIQDYNATGNLNSANVTIGFVSDAYNFYTPLVIGNITLDSVLDATPNITINLPTNNSFSSSASQDVNFTVQDSNLNTCWYSNDTYTANTTLTNCNTNITTVQWSEGQHNLTIWVNDTTNNVNSSMVTFTIDTTFPTWSANETNLTSSTLNGKGVYFNITLTDTNPSTYIFSWYNGTAWENTTSSYTNAQEVSLTKTINIDIATINWTWYINDSANNLNQTDIWSITLLADDNVPPNISFANPTTNATNLSQNFIFANLSFADATSSISMANISLFNSTQNIINSTQGTTSTLEINFTGLADGTYYLNASVNDSLGNRNQTETRIIRLDTIFPTLNFINPTINTSNLSQNFITANLSFTETNLNFTNISLYNSTQNIINSTTGTTSPVYINFSGLSDGIYYLNATIGDTSGNKNQTETRIIGLDRVAPNLTINSPTTGTYETSTILFNTTSIDATTLVDSCWYTTNSGTTNRTLSKDGATNYYNFTASGISDSTYTARFYCNDSANNVNNTQTIAFTINTFVPAGGGPAPVSAGGAGGGGASKPEKKRIFNLGYNMYDQTISLNQVEFDKLRITNNGETADEYNIEVKTIDNIISFEERKIKLEPGESKDIEFKISSPKEPGIYTGKIIVSNGVSEREVLVAINVKTEKSLFDITLTIPESLKTLLIGQNLISKIDLIQMGLKENIDVTLNYAIKDFEGQTYLSESETIAVLDQKSYEKEFFTGELPPGQYVLGTELIHPDGVAVASTHFVVQERGIKFGKSEILLTSLILVLVLISLVLFLSIRKYKRIGKTLKTGRK